MDLLTPEEGEVDVQSGEYRFDIDLLAERVGWACDWLKENATTAGLPVGCFGASTGAAAALVAAAERPDTILVVVSRGGRPDLAAAALPKVQAPTLLIVGGDDAPVIGMNRTAMAQLKAETKLEIVPGATHLFEEPGTLDQVAELARQWFRKHLSRRAVWQSKAS
jgi:dienelactone hydrolase